MIDRMRAVLGVCAASAMLAACAMSPVPRVAGGPPMAFSPDLLDRVSIGRIDAEGVTEVIERYAQTQGDYAAGDRTDPAWNLDPLSDLNFRMAIESEVGEELRLCATGDRRLDARILIDQLTYDDRLRSLVDGRGLDWIGGVVEFVEPDSDVVVARYEIEAGTNSGGLLTRIVSDRTDAAAEEFGRALCHEAFGRNPRGSSIRNSTRG